MSTPPNTPEPVPDGAKAPTEVVTALISPDDVARLDHAAARRGVERGEVVAQAIDAFLAREMWSGGFIAPPPPMEIPGPYPWSAKALRLRHRR
jgi:hypothetical protein